MQRTKQIYLLYGTNTKPIYINHVYLTTYRHDQSFVSIPANNIDITTMTVKLTSNNLSIADNWGLVLLSINSENGIYKPSRIYNFSLSNKTTRDSIGSEFN